MGSNAPPVCRHDQRHDAWAVQTSPTTINIECQAYLFRDIWEATEPNIKRTLKEPTRVGNVFFLEALDSNDLVGIDHMAHRTWARRMETCNP